MTSLSQPLKRVKRKIEKCPNPLFEKWLREWQDEAVANGSDMQYCFKKALKSLRKFPVRLDSGKECIMLENFGAKICKMLDDKLEKYKASNPQDLNPVLETETIKTNSIIDALNIDFKSQKCQNGRLSNGVTRKRKSSETTPRKNKKVDVGEECDVPESNFGRRKVSEYVPAYRSGAYAILITLFDSLEKDNFKGFMTKTEIQKLAQELCDSSFTKSSTGSHYTAWSSMGVLVKKELVRKEGNPAKFSLTEKGTDLAINLKLSRGSDRGVVSQQPQGSQTNLTASPLRGSQPMRVTKPSKTLKSPRAKDKSRNLCLPENGARDTISVQSCSQEHEGVSEPDETIFLLPGSFQIILIVDTHERDEKSQQADNMTMRQLKSRGVNFEIRHLKVGDFIWIARELNSGHELVLPYIVERKRMDDLASSIKDGRFHEQKFRLKLSGIENLIYLVEKFGSENQRLGLPLPTLHQAMSNTQVLNGFTVRVTNNHDHSMRYLDCMTTQLNNIFRAKTLMSCKKENLSPVNLSDDLISLMSFKDFNKGSEKNKKFTIRSMLIKHLLQLSGISVEKARAIAQLYPTPKALMEALRRGEGERAIAELTFGGLNRSIGPVTAKQIQMLYTSTNLT